MAQTVAELKAEYTDRSVEADSTVADLARFKGKVGRVVTVNENGRALVDFGEGPWYDIALSHLEITDKPATKDFRE